MKRALLLMVSFLAGAATNVVGQTSDPKFLSAPEFVLSADAVAAGIDGSYKAGLSIDEAGNVKNVRLYSDPAWPCDTSPDQELKEVRVAVENHLKTVKFSPALKNGKPHETEVMLDFAIGKAFRRAGAPDDARSSSSPKVVKAGVVNGRAVTLARPFRSSGAKGISEVQVLIDELGNVSKAGVMRGNPLLSKSSREAACRSKFSPTLLDGKPVQVTGVVSYVYR